MTIYAIIADRHTSYIKYFHCENQLSIGITMTLHNPSTDLFSPMTLGALSLANRIVMAPLTRSRMGADGVPNEMHARYYAQRASAGMIISEATNISAQARGYDLTPGIWTEEQVAGWKLVTDAVHAAGGLIVCQLWHVGRFSHVDLQPDGAAPVAPSAIKAEGQTFTENGMMDVSMPRALETSEIPGIIEQYRHAARCAKRAGFDGVEVHSANSYLLDQFVRDSTNQRNDQYGGSIENRSRLTLEVTDAVVEIWGHDRVGIRLSPVTPDAGNTPLDSQVMQTYGYLIEQLNRFQLAYMHFVEGATATSRVVPDNVDLDALRALFTGPFIGNNNYDLELAVTRRAQGKIDAVAFGRPFIANPDLVRRLQEGAELAVAPRETYYGNGAAGYTDWPTLAQ
tara:strand:- start:5272 stop:6462 length:1191 start_codon:yes stop_codon:yes gene_type:complete